jgi:hypothetical protein
MLLKNLYTINVSRFVFSAKSNITDKSCAYPSGAPRGYPSLGLKAQQFTLVHVQSLKA